MALWNLGRGTTVRTLSKLKTQAIIISLQASFLPMQMFVCGFACAKRLKLNHEARFGWISRFEAL
jgi:aerobic-type carbon monoxide dehydrogenase small subunit (CoxS/CutS family)